MTVVMPLYSNYITLGNLLFMHVPPKKKLHTTET